MRHAGHLHVGAEIFRAEDLRRHVFAFDRLADDLVLARLLRLRLAGRIERIAPLLVPVELDVEIAPADQLGVARLLVAVERGVDDAVHDDELIGRRAELLGRHLDQHAARFRRRHAHLLAAELDAGGAGRAALVHRGRGVAHEHRHGLERNVELFGHHLADGDEQAVAHVHLAEERRDRAVGIDRDVGGELVRHQRGLRALRMRRIDREQRVEAERRADRHHERARALEQRAAGERGRLVHFGHVRLPQPIIVAARLTARRMPMCVPQRHFRPSSACLISASLGFFFSASSAAAVMIQPLMQ